MKKVLSFLIVMSAFNNIGYSQVPNYLDNCAGAPCVTTIPENKIVRIGDDEIHLGEGVIDRYNVTDNNFQYSYDRIYEFRYPCNHPTWPIAMVHAWSLFRSVTGIVNHSINSSAAIVTNESQMACGYNFDMSCHGPAQNVFDPDVWRDGTKGHYVGYVTENTTFKSNNSGSHSDGCFHIDGLGRANLIETTSACGTCGFFQTDAQASQNVKTFETAVLSRAYYDLSFHRHMEDVRGWDPTSVFNATNDKYATDEIFAYAYNKGPYGAILGMAETVFSTNIPGAIASTDWIASGYVNGIGYNESVRRYDKILSNDYTPLTPNDKQRWLNWYDNDVTWAIMDNYLTIVFPMHNLTIAEETYIRSEVQSVFDQQKDGSGNVSFRYKLGPVIDRIVELLPYTEPSYTNTSSQNAVSTCKGCVGPYVPIKTDVKSSICTGQSAKIETDYGAGYTYYWLKDEVEINNTNPDQHIFYATESGTYAVIVENEAGCAIRSDGDIVIQVDACSSCDLTADLSPNQNSCTDIGDGSIDVTLGGGSYNPSGNYTFSWTLPDGSTLVDNDKTLDNLIQGNYMLEVYENGGNASCKGYGNVTFKEQEVVYQKLNIITANDQCDSKDLTAEVLGNPPADCDYTLRIEATPDGSGKCWGIGWTDTEHKLLVNINGVSIGNMNPDPPTDGSTCIVFEDDFGVSDGDEIEVIIKGISCNSVSALNRNFTLENATGVQATATSGALSKGENIIISAIATCDQPDVNYTIAWNNDPTVVLSGEVSTQNRSDLNAQGLGWVKVEASSPSNNCTLVDSVRIYDTCNTACNNPGNVTLSKSGTDNICLPISESITVNVTGSGNFEYSHDGTVWQDQNTFTLNTVGAHQIHVRDKDAQGDASCLILSNSYEIVGVSRPTIAVGSPPVQCGGMVDLDTVFTESAGTLSIYTNSAATTIATNPVSSTGTYYAKAVEGVCESSVEPVLVTINEVPQSSLTTKVIEICDDGSEFGVLDVSVVAGNPNYTITLNTGKTKLMTGSTDTIRVTGTGTYTISSVADASCTNSTTNTGVVTVDPRDNMSVTNIQTSCNSNNTVKLTFDIVGGDEANYTVTGLLGATYSSGTFTIDNLAENVDHTFGVEDGTNCNYITNQSSGVRSCSCTETVELALVSGEPNTICNDGTTTDLEIEVSGGVTNGSFELHRNGVIVGSAYTNQSDGTFTISVSDTGLYTIENYSGGCTASILGTVQVSYIPTTDITTDPVSPSPLCEGVGNINLSVAATGDNLSYQWKLNGTDIPSATNAAYAKTGLALSDSGDYTVEVTGTCGVETSAAAKVVVNENTGTIAGFTSGVATSCENGVATFEIDPVSGTNVQYAWTTSPSLSATSTTTGQSLTFGNASSYQVTVTATGDCGVATSNDTTVTITGAETLSFDLDTTIVCEEGISTASVTNLQGGGANPTFDWTATTAANSGSTTSALNITSATSGSTLSVTVRSNSTCITGTNPVTRSLTIATKDKMEGTIEPECKDNTAFYQIRIKITKGLLTNPNNILVTGGTIPTWTLVASGEWLSSDIPESETVKVEVVNENGCEGLEQLNVNKPCACPSKAVLEVVGNSTVCKDSTVTLRVNITSTDAVPGPFDVTVTGPSYVDTKNSQSGTYTIEVTNVGTYEITSFNDQANTCGASGSTQTVSNHSQVSASISLEGTNNNVCSNGEVERELNVTMSPSSSIYRITYTDGTASQTVTTTNNPYVITTTEGGNYSLTQVLDGNNCPAELQGSVSIVEQEVPTLTLNTNDTSICVEDRAIELEATTTGNRVKWYMSETSSDLGPVINEGLTYETKEAGVYYVVSEVGGMERCATGEITKLNVVDIAVVNPTYAPNPVELGKKLTLQTEVTPAVGYNYVWKIDNGEGGEATGNPGTYKTEVEGKHDIRVEVMMDAAPFCEKEVYVGEVTVFAPVLIPNVFTPNGDEEGDVWEVTGMKGFKSTIRIYNRWGNLVFESFNYDDPWDGTYNGKPSPDGVYFYFIEITDPLYEGEKEIQGQIQILR